MQSSLLTNLGLVHFVAGADYNFRVQTMGPQVAGEIQRAMSQLDCPIDQLYSGQQTHSANLAYCDGKEGPDYYLGKQFEDTDGLITDQPGVGLLIKYADCTPILFYDPIKKVQASVHSGWRGTVKQIGLRTIERLEADFACKREDIRVYIGPCIDQDHYQVGPEVYEAFAGLAGRDEFFREDGDRYRLSMAGANEWMMLANGIKGENLQVCPYSTFTDLRLNSARRQGPDYRLNALISVIPK
ncbi:polyphenol oxidase family protein [Vaginisenegalia massiliensis]|uniref:polyphenol oxidase family protein n=1 Tax=Vaginisenegalia massiliensis TaxID=2058294 RepID=UPI000F542F33|nr:polyphenol oxidase family protein [Vaginisenegalia massiliensis]